MLDKWITQPSKSPLSSPIILVGKKNDVSWLLHWALNAITIKDKFLIRTFDELIDELYEANNFSKLDLKSKYH